MSELKVGDLVPLKQSLYDNTLVVVEELLKLVKEYRDADLDPYALETIKKEFIGYMFSFAGFFSQIKCYKSDSHTFLSETRKRIKAEALDILLNEGQKVTAAESLVYGTKYYKERVTLLEEIKAFMIKMDLYETLFQSTLQAIIQSLSAARKEMENSKHT